MAQVPPAARGMQVPLVQAALGSHWLSLTQPMAGATALILQLPTSDKPNKNGATVRARAQTAVSDMAG
jgi:hypothetical protein